MSILLVFFLFVVAPSFGAELSWYGQLKYNSTTKNLSTTNPLAQPGIYTADYSEGDQGAVGGGRTIKDLIDSIGITNKAKIILAHNSGAEWTDYVFSTSADYSANANIIFEFEQGARTAPVLGITVTIHSPAKIKARPDQQIKSGTGTLAFSVPGIVYAEWFGAKGDGTTDDGAAFNSANVALPASGGDMILSSSIYYIETPFVPTKPFRLLGKGKRGTTTLLGHLRTAPNGKTCSSTIIRVDTLTGVEIRDILFDGAHSPPYSNTNFGDAGRQSLLEITGSSDVTVKNVNFTRYFAEYGTSGDHATWKICPIYVYASSKTLIEDVELLTPTYGNLLIALDVTYLKINRVAQTFLTGAGSVNETPLAIYGPLTKYVTITNSNFENCTGSAINLGGMGHFLIAGNTFVDSKGIDLSDEGMWSQYVGHPDMYDVVISGNTFSNPQSYIMNIGDLRSAQLASSHEISIIGNTSTLSVGNPVMPAITVGNAVQVNIVGNILNGGTVQVTFSNLVNVSSNVLNGCNLADGGAGVVMKTRADASATFHHTIKNNLISYFSDAAIIVYTYASSIYSNFTIEGNDLAFSVVPTTYMAIGTPPGTYKVGALKIANNTLNGKDYVPFRGTDTAIYYTTLDLGAMQSTVGSFTRDISTATGTQAITGVGFLPKVVFFLTVEDTGNMASWGFGNSATALTTYNTDNAAAGTFATTTGAIRVQDGAADIYTGGLNSLDADGFTIAWVKTGNPTGTITVRYLAIK